MEHWQQTYLGTRQISGELDEFELWLWPGVPLGLFAVIVAAAMVHACNYRLGGLSRMDSRKCIG